MNATQTNDAPSLAATLAAIPADRLIAGRDAFRTRAFVAGMEGDTAGQQAADLAAAIVSGELTRRTQASVSMWAGIYSQLAQHFGHELGNGYEHRVTSTVEVGR
jgi:hypothetical protein